MGNPLTDRATPGELAERDQVIDFKGNLSILERLGEVVRGEFAALAATEIPQNWQQIPVSIKLRFHWADGRRQLPAADGSVEARVPMVCQRCLEPFAMDLAEPLRLLFAATEGGTPGDADYDVWEMDEETIRPLAVAEELLMMALPLAAVHESMDDCKAPAQSGRADRTDKVRPFAGLRSQLRDRD
jgi:uncharacterized protein